MKLPIEVENVLMYSQNDGEIIIEVTRTRDDGFDGRIFNNDEFGIKNTFSKQKYSFLSKFYLETLAESESDFKTKCPEYFI